MKYFDEMYQLALTARSHAYAPYSNFLVGSCIRTVSGQYFVGSNVENAAYSVAQCSEASAIGAMVSAGETQIESLLVICGGELLGTPCGSCRQRICEFATPNTPIHVCDLQGLRQTFTLGELLPHAFTKQNLQTVK